MTALILIMFFASFISAGMFTGNSAAEAIIIDHTCTNLSRVPSQWIEQAKAQFRMSYGHTSHGSQIISGMNALKGSEGPLFYFSRDGSGGALSLHDTEPSGDLGNPDRTSWADRTRSLLGSPYSSDRNVIMWSWCGQVSNAKESDIETYLSLMSRLEKEYPEVTFIYMTGHTDGTGAGGNLNLRNEQIRRHCRENGKVLFDFADIESWNPDGTCYPDTGDSCAWCATWCGAHPGDCSELPGCAHSHGFNCILKGKAFWWMMARLAGWDGGAEDGGPEWMQRTPDEPEVITDEDGQSMPASGDMAGDSGSPPASELHEDAPGAAAIMMAVMAFAVTAMAVLIIRRIFFS